MIFFSFLITLVFVLYLSQAQLVKDPSLVSIFKDSKFPSIPYINANLKFINGKIHPIESKEFASEASSPILDGETGKRVVIGHVASMTVEDVNEIIQTSTKAWDNGHGTWPQLKPSERIEIIERIVESLLEKRDEIINVLMWEICKTKADATSEFDRTMEFIRSTIQTFKDLNAQDNSFNSVSGILARVRRGPRGIVLVVGPYNYPFNETYATLIPALLMGNIVVMKIPALGGLAHYLTIDAYSKHLPPGVLSFLSGKGREVLPPLMSSGEIDSLAFIGGSRTADTLIKLHPHPHRLHTFLQLEGKNLGIVLPNIVSKEFYSGIDNKKDIEQLNSVVDQLVLGSTSFNGQRCTAIKLIMIPKTLAKSFLPVFSKKVNSLKYGLPWETGIAITPLPEENKLDYLSSIIMDAVEKGASVINNNNEDESLNGGGDIYGKLMRPAIIFPVTPSMRLFHEEQFGPVIPIATYDSIDEVKQIIKQSPYGQQASIFTYINENTDKTQQVSTATELVDTLSSVVGRINVNTQCGRSPDVLPFSGRRRSALGTMSVSESLKAFSIEVVVAGKENDINKEILELIENSSNFLSVI